MNISAIILAAGESKRMGQPKMALQWSESTVLGHVISVFARAGIQDIVVVTGAVRNKTEQIVSAAQTNYPVRSEFNAGYQKGEMLSSIQCGIRDLLGKPVGATLIGLGDQPQVQERNVRMVCEAFQKTGSPLVVPSYQMRRGHPWLIARELWQDFLGFAPPQTPRDFLRAHAEKIQHVEVDSESILQDLDTPQDYQSATRY